MLDRIIIADDINRWLKYFFNSHKYRRTIDFAKRVKDTIPKLRLEERDILDDPFFKYERDSWQELAETYIGDDIEESIQSLKEVIEKLKDLLQENFLTNNRFGLSLIIVKMRLRRILGVAYNNLGYSYTTLRQYKKASEQYMYALRYLRDTGFLNMEAITRNNLSRVLAEQGLITRAIRICRNGLELKEKLGYEAPIAVSYSTLALIYNKGMSPENAWVDAAMAVAYFRKLENERGYGLALTHLAEALRRMASSPREKLDKPDELFETAIEAIEKAAKIFINNPERMRLIEVSIEQGCVYREYMHYLKETNQPQYKDYIDDTIFPLEEACNLAGDLSYPYHAIDAHVNLAWAYYYMDEIKKAKGALKTCWNMARDIAEKEHWELIEDAHKPPTAKDMEPQLYKLLGKAWLLKGKIELDEFVRLTRTIKEEEEKTQQEDIHNRSFFDEEVETKEARHQIIHENKGAKRIMKEAAEAFVLSLAYNRLFSARSQYIPVAFDTLYTYLKRFNRVELKDFVSYQTEARDMYHVDQVKPNDLTDMGVFLEQSFGDYSVVLPGLED